MADATGEEGQTLEITADVQNADSSQATKTVELVVDNGVGTVDSASITIGANTTVSQVLQWATSTGDAGTYTVTYQSPDDSVTRQIEVVEPGTQPPAASDLLAHYDATAISANDGDAVSTWSDSSGSGNAASAGDAPTYKTNQIGGKPVVRFNGAANYLTNTLAAQSQPNHIFVVGRFQSFSTTTFNYAFGGVGDNNANNIDRHTFGVSDTGNWFMIAGNFDLANVGSATTGNAFISSQFYNTTNSTHRINGTQVASGDVGSKPLSDMTLGAKGDLSEFGEIDIGEVLVYPQDKSGIETDVESYLSNKWGVTL